MITTTSRKFQREFFSLIKAKKPIEVVKTDMKTGEVSRIGIFNPVNETMPDTIIEPCPTDTNKEVDILPDMQEEACPTASEKCQEQGCTFTALQSTGFCSQHSRDRGLF
jgi:hypothetical protein